MKLQLLGDRYEVQQELAKKAGRKTLLARDLQTQELVVIKLLSFGTDFEWNDLKLFEREAQTLKALDHPAIPSYIDFFEVDLHNSKGFALVQSYVEGQSLESNLKAGRNFSESEVKQLASSLLETLIYLHSRQPSVIHRDIKPSNIILSNRSGNSIGEVYLVDFGSVQTLAAREGGTMTVVGTYGYMPPEQFGERTVPASDLYSLGATLITLITGTHPADLPHKDGRIQFEQAVNISPELTNWLKWMTQPSLDRRLTSAQAALQELEKPTPLNFAPLVINKPTGSKVSLYKDVNSLEILIPPQGLSVGVIFLCLFAIAWNSFLVMWIGITVFSTPVGINLFFALFSLPFWGAGISMVLMILFTLFGRVRLRLNQQQISLTYDLFGFKYNRPRSAQRQDINKLEHTKRSYRRDSDGDRFEVKPQINIWAGTHKYELGNNGSLTEPELDWLACELSDWLEIPITKE